jgi:hypothetical protein
MYVRAGQWRSGPEGAYRSFSVTATDFPAENLQILGKIGVNADELLRQIEISARLVFVIRDDEDVAALGAIPAHEAVEAGENHIERFAVLLRSTGENQVVLRMPS